MAATKKKYRRRTKSVFKRVKGLSQKVEALENEFKPKNFPTFFAGDTVRVHVKIKEGEKERIQNYEGIVIGKYNRGGNRSFVVRKISHGVGVERIFQESSPKIAAVEVMSVGRVRRAKLYYLRKLEGKAAKVQREVDTNQDPGPKTAPVSAEG